MPPIPRIARVVVATVAATSVLAATPPPAAAARSGYGERLVVGRLENAAAFTFAPDGRIFAAERLTGRIEVINPATGGRRTFASVPHVVGEKNNELGLDGIELHPQFPRRPYVYAYATVEVRGTVRIRIIRYTASQRGGRGRGIEPRVIYQSRTAAGPMHVGGRMLFGPDGNLYVIIGDAGTAKNAQDLAIERGKLLRMTPRGGPIPSNPFGSRVWSYGHRNSFGFDFDPRTGTIWETENGPECNDEINRVVPGGNYAWGPHESCSTPPPAPENTNQDGPTPRRMPRMWYGATIGPTGLAFCRRCDLGAKAQGAAFFGSFNHGTITRITLSDDRRDIVASRIVLVHLPRVLSIETGPNGRLYFSDGGGIYRITPGA
jgi:glucose/arabinose dehydrogenase